LSIVVILDDRVCGCVLRYTMTHFFATTKAQCNTESLIKIFYRLTLPSLLLQVRTGSNPSERV